MGSEAVQNAESPAELKVSEIVERALEQWVEITGISRGQTTFRLGDLGVSSMNDIMDEAMKLDPEGTTTYLLLECFLREYLESKTFTAAQIMKDYAATSKYLQKAEELFSLVQSDRAVEIASGFRARVLEGVRHYKADREDVVSMIEDPDVMPFLRRDALHSLEALRPYQFLIGEHDGGPAQVVEHVYQAWDINDLLKSLRDMPVSGIAVVLLRDPAHPDRSYFAFAMRNGGNVTIFTDKSKPAYPGQEDSFSFRGRNRSFQKREWENHFPYQLIKKWVDERGDIHFEKERSLAAHGLNLVPLMRIRELPPHQVIWLTMMLSLISEKFWKREWQAKELCYTGEMVKHKSLLISDEAGRSLPAAQGYVPITLEDVDPADLNASFFEEHARAKSKGMNAWLEERYSDRVTSDVVNQWSPGHGKSTLLLAPNPDDGQKASEKFRAVVAEAGDVITVDDQRRVPFWEAPKGHVLQSYSGFEFGTEEELKADRIWIARYNMAMHIQRSADLEYAERKDEVTKWYTEAVKSNLSGVLDLIAKKSLGLLDYDNRWHPPFLTVAPIKDNEWKYHDYSTNLIGGVTENGRQYSCILTGAAATYRAHFVPREAAELEMICGLQASRFPDVLQDWKRDRRGVDLDVPNRPDPMDFDLEDPWQKLTLNVTLHLSKRGLAKIQKGVR